MIRQHTVQKQQARFLPQQIRLLNIFHLTTVELEQRIRQELEENPLLEERAEDGLPEEATEGPQDFADWDEFGYDDIPDYRTEYANFFSDRQMPDRPIAQGADFRVQLKTQLHLLPLTEQDMQLACFLVDSLNDVGMLDQELSSLAEDYSFSQGAWVEANVLEGVLKLIQSMDPPGLGARNIRECLLLQLDRKNREDPMVQMATSLISDYYDALNNQQVEKILQGLNIDENSLRDILQFIAGLQLHPLHEEGSLAQRSQLIIPDFIITLEDDRVVITLARQKSLQINHSWMDNVKQLSGTKDRAANTYLKSKLQSAEWFISSLQQREQSMLRIMRAIVDWQKPYFTEGDPLLLRPMVLRNIAEATRLDMSTVSRITSNKYAATPFGNILLKDLFTEGIENAMGESVSSRVIRETIRELVAAENRAEPYTDHELADILHHKGFRIARRTIAKYRDLLHIPAARLRALWRSTPTK